MTRERACLNPDLCRDSAANKSQEVRACNVTDFIPCQNSKLFCNLTIN